MVVIGGGIAGLTAAYAVARDGAPGTQVILVDGANQLGGKLRVSPVGGVPVDEGAEAMLARAPEGVALANELGLDDSLAFPADVVARLVVDGRARPLPAGTLMGVPADPDAVRESGVLPDRVVRRIAAEPDKPARTLPDREDVAVGALVESRLGREVVDRLVDPLLGGVYAGRADLLSLRATIPGLAAGMAETGSLVEAARAARERAPASDGPIFVTLHDGMGSLPELVARAAPVSVRLGLPVRGIQRVSGGFRLIAGPLPRPTYLTADAVVVAAPASKAARMLAETAPWAAAELRGIQYASVAIVTLAYRAEPPSGSGMLVPAIEGRTVKALTFSTTKWPHLAGSGLVVVRASVGRFGDTAALRWTDDDLVRVVSDDVAALTGLTGPVESRVTRWGGALPQYAVGHLDRVRRIRASVDRVPGLAVCGAAYEGVGVPACIRTGRAAAAKILGYLAGRVDPR